MNRRHFKNFKDASDFARQLARKTGTAARLVRNSEEWAVVHPNIEPILGAQKNTQRAEEKSNEQKKNSSIVQPKLKSIDKSFRFVIRRNNSKSPTFSNDPELDRKHLVSIVEEFFPNAIISSSVKSTTEMAHINITGWREEYLVIISVTDEAMSANDFDDTLNELAEEFQHLRINY